MKKFPMKKIILALSALPLIAACGANTISSKNVNSEGLWTSGPIKGHEILTRNAIEKVIPRLSYPYFKSVDEYETPNDHPLIRGNLITDWADNREGEFDIRKYYNVYDTSVRFSDIASLNNNHFMRSYHADGRMQTAREACLESENRIKKALYNADIALHKKDDKKMFLNFVGHASHIIQDSFSQAHTKRSATDNHKLLDLCLLEQNIPGICFHKHSPADLRDFLYKGRFTFIPGTMNEFAVEAIDATTEFLYIVAEHYIGDDDFNFNKLIKDVNKFMFTDYAPGTGYFSCDYVIPR